MTLITDENINEIRNNTDIVEIISNYVPLVKKGKNYFGVCPFHDDHSPSMSVDPAKQIYKCFSCGNGGNVFTFIMNYENISFIEAVKLLGRKLGYNIDNIKDSSNVNAKDYQAYELAFKYYQNNINTSLGKNAIEYLNKRNISHEIIKKFGIGLALNDNKLNQLLLNKGYNINELINIGLINENSTDFFLNRIMFPIWDLTGKVVAFSGRIYNTKSDSKYVNSRESKIFKKGSILYNYHNAKNILKKNDYIIVMEGFLDVIRASTIGLDSCVATLGTAITKDHINLLKKISDNIILCFDGDSAGEKATITCANMLYDSNINPKIIRLEENLDPDEYILKYGKDKFINKIKNPLSLTEFNLLILKQDKNLNKIEDIAKYVNEALIELLKESDEIKNELILKKISTEYDIEYQSIKNKYLALKENFNNRNKKIKEETVVIKNKKIKRTTIAQTSLLYYMLKDNDIITIAENRVSYMPTDRYRNLYNEIIYYYHKYGKLLIADFITHLLKNNSELFNTYQEIEILDIPDNYTMEAIDDYIKAISYANIEERKNIIKKQIKEEPDEIEASKIINKKFGLVERG